MAVEIVGSDEAVKRYREMLHAQGTFTKRFKKEIEDGVMLPKHDDYRTIKAFIEIDKKELGEGESDTQEEQPENLMKIVGTANENAVDRMDERLAPEGVDTTNFQMNPVLLADHMYFTRATIGTVENVTPEQDGVKFVANLGYPDKGELTETQREIRSLISQGLLKTVSVGFIPLKIKAPEFDGDGRLVEPAVILQWELLEISVVAVPANAGSTFEMKHIAQRLGYADSENIKTLTSETDASKNSRHTLKSTDQTSEQEDKKNMDQELKEFLESILLAVKANGEAIKSYTKGKESEDEDEEELEEEKSKKDDDEKDEEGEKALTEIREAVKQNAESIEKIAIFITEKLAQG